MAELAHRAHADGVAVVYACCEEDGAPYQPWIEILAQCGRVLEHPSGNPEGARLRLYAAVADGLRAIKPPGIRSRAPLCVVIDDLHWADRPSLRLLAHLLRGGAAPEPLPMLLLLTFRDTEPGELLPDLLAELRKEPGVERLALAGLGDADVGRLAAAIVGHALSDSVIADLSERTGGVPYFGVSSPFGGESRRVPGG